MKFNYSGNSKSPGIYKIINTHTSRIYIGQAKSFQQRWQQHSVSLRSSKHQNKFIQSDYVKCKEEFGHDDFLEFHVIEVMAGSTKEERNKREEVEIALYFDKGKQCYNFKEKAESAERSCFSSTPEQTKAKLSEIAKLRWQDPEYREHMKSVVFTPEHQEKALAGLKAYQDQNRETIAEVAKQQWVDLKADEEKLAAYKQKKREQAIKMHADPELKAKIVKGHSDPSVRKIMSEKNIERQSDPVYRDRISQGMKNYYLNNPEQVQVNAERLAKAREKFRSDPEKVKAAELKKLQAIKDACKPYTFVDPSGNEVTVTNVRDWCRTRGFVDSHFYRLANSTGYNETGSVMKVYGYSLPGCVEPVKTLIDADGNKVTFTDLVEWCKSKNLDPCSFYLLFSHKAKSAHGYTLPSHLRQDNSLTLIDPEGKTLEIEDRFEWCREKGFRVDSVKRLINGKAKSYRGYTLPSMT